MAEDLGVEGLVKDMDQGENILNETKYVADDNSPELVQGIYTKGKPDIMFPDEDDWF